LSLTFSLSDEEIEKFSKQGPPPCSQADPEAFFPQENYDSNGDLISSSYYDESGAKAICSGCPYRLECLKLALEINADGIWGGTSGLERKTLMRRLKRSGKSLKIENLQVR
jgi:hypothetical protein